MACIRDRNAYRKQLLKSEGWIDGMEKRKGVLILCALSSTEKYIRAQLDSVEAQDYKDWEILFSNDLANDATMEIVNEFMAKDPRIHIMDNNSGRRGAHGNFRNLVVNSNGDSFRYFAYMDNDDVWKPDKLSCYVETADGIKQAKGEDTPICFTCNMEVIDENGTLRDPDFASTYEYEILHPMDSFFTHRVFGCNLFFDWKVYEAVKAVMKDPDFPPTISFDNFTYQTAAAIGAAQPFIPKVLMSYRRHSTNSTSGAVYKINAGYLMKMAGQISTVIHNNAFIARDSIDAIDRILALDLPQEKRKELLEIREGLEQGGIRAMKMWRKYHINCGNALRTAENWLSLCLGLERKYMDRERYPEL